MADLTTEEGRGAFSVSMEEMTCSWATALEEARRPASWAVYDRLISRGTVGVLVPSFAPGRRGG